MEQPAFDAVELQYVSSAFGLACFHLRRGFGGQAGAAPPPAAPPLFFSRAIFSLASLEQGKDFTVSLPRPPVRGYELTPYLITDKILKIQNCCLNLSWE